VLFVLLCGCVLSVTGVASRTYRKAAPWKLFAVTLLVHGGANDFRNEFFRQFTNLGMSGNGFGQRTTPAANHKLFSILLNSGRAAQSFQHVQRFSYSLDCDWVSP
jgi:hypothetical protein